MDWFNYYGLIIVAILMVPNIIYFNKNNKLSENKEKIRAVEFVEKFSRYLTVAFMILNIPYTFKGFYFEKAIIVYFSVNAALVFSYLITWLIFWKKENIAKTLLLSIIPSLIFLFSGIMIVSIPLICFGLIFSVCHIAISLREISQKQ